MAGEKLFSFTAYSIVGWDGSYNGNILPSSDYWYVFKINSGIEKVGHFTLKR